MDIQQFSQQNNIKDKEIVNAVKSQFPKYSPQIHSHVKKPNEYGITLIDTAKELIRTTFSGGAPEATRAKQRDRHRLPCRVSCRLTKKRKRLLELGFRADGHKTIQDGMNFLIDQYLGGQS